MEYLTVVTGTGRLEIKGRAPVLLSENSVAVVPMGVLHRMVNTGKTGALSYIGFQVETSKMEMNNLRTWSPTSMQRSVCPSAH